MQKTVTKSTSLPSLSLISTPLNIITLVSDAYFLATNLILMLLGRKWLIPIQYQYLSIDDTQETFYYHWDQFQHIPPM